jgi:hypothetical protein
MSKQSRPLARIAEAIASQSIGPLVRPSRARNTGPGPISPQKAAVYSIATLGVNSLPNTPRRPLTLIIGSPPPVFFAPVICNPTFFLVFLIGVSNSPTPSITRPKLLQALLGDEDFSEILLQIPHFWQSLRQYLKPVQSVPNPKVT